MVGVSPNKCINLMRQCASMDWQRSAHRLCTQR